MSVEQSSITVTSCQDDANHAITNVDGTLQCAGAGNGNYGSSCSGCVVAGGTLTCTACTARDGSKGAPTSVTLSDCTSFFSPQHMQPPDVVNNNGELACAISGSFVNSCSGCYISEMYENGNTDLPEGNQLTCSCKRDWDDSAQDDLDTSSVAFALPARFRWK